MGGREPDSLAGGSAAIVPWSVGERERGRVTVYVGLYDLADDQVMVASDVRTCYAFTKDAVKLAVGQDVKSRVAERGDKGFNMYAYMCMSLDGTRMEEKKVVAIYCDESP
jgi:hypothetical protein